MQVQEWTSHSGANVTIGGILAFEIWKHGGATKMVPDPESACGNRGTHYRSFDVEDGVTWDEFAELAVESWKTEPELWEECD